MTDSTGVTPDQFTALRLALTGQADEAERVRSQIIGERAWDGFGELLLAAFSVAVRQYFAPQWTIPQVVEYVTRLRVTFIDDDSGEFPDVDPRAAENLIRRALDNDVRDDFGDEVKARAQFVILLHLVFDSDMTEPAIDDLLAQARDMANEIIADRPAR